MANRLSREEIILALLDAAFFRSAGATSLADVAGVLGIQKASLYNHFAGRDDLIAQATGLSAERLLAVPFAPSNLGAVVQKHSARAVLRQMVVHFCTEHEKRPLLQMYAFIQEQQYCSRAAADVVSEQRSRMTAQTEQVLRALSASGRIGLAAAEIPVAARWFCMGAATLLSDYVLERKRTVEQNPAYGSGELFSLPPATRSLEAVRRSTEQFVALALQEGTASAGKPGKEDL